MQQDFVASGRQDLGVPIWAVKGGELLQRAFIMLAMGYCSVSSSKSEPLSKTDPF